MARIHLDQIAHAYGDKARAAGDWALKPMDHAWEDGGAYALLGPSGCGKTTLLNVISGLVTPSDGQVRFDGDDITPLPTERRNIAQVFQFPVVYDTMTVYDNLAFPLRNRGIGESDVDDRVREIAGMLDLESELKRRANGLSADAKQKISLGRGLVRSDVAAILFDEPLTVIDPLVKWQLRRKLKEIHERLALTLIYVTHDQNEALTFADKVAVMYDGEVLQVGTPQELFEAPAHRFVGYFIGSPGMNFMPCSLVEGGVSVAGQAVSLNSAAPDHVGARLELGVRPEFVSLASAQEGGLDVGIEAVEDLGNYKIVTCRLGEHPVKMKLPEDMPVPDGRASVRFDPDMTRLYVDERMHRSN